MSGIDVVATERLSGLRFREAREADWERLEELLGRIERGRTGSLTDEDLFELPVLYRATLSSLSVARETSLDVDLITYLEALCTRAYFIMYGVHEPFFKRLGRFFAGDWPAAVRALWLETLLATLITIVGVIAGYLLVRADPSWFYAIVEDSYAGGRDPTASMEQLRRAIYDSGPELLGFSAQLFAHNSQIALLCFALGFAFGVPTVLLLLQNGLLIGAFYAIYVPKGLGWQFSGWLSIHGTTELFAIMIAGAAGMRIGAAVAFPGRRARMASAVHAGQTSGLAMLGVVVMLGCAGFIEGVGRQVIVNDWLRAAIGASMFVLWIAYFYFWPRRGAARHG